MVLGSIYPFFGVKYYERSAMLIVTKNKNKKNMRKTKVISGLICSLIIFNNICVVSPVNAAAEPYQKTFIVTAYYSPLPDQNYYVTGSLAGDKRLNGNGTNGADGTPVYPGMIAAPGTYGFGTRISCPPYIDGEIHDRGGAIVKAGTRNNAHDRLDFWAGEGEGALKTALYWGKRTLTCTVYPAGTNPGAQYVSLPEGKLSDFAKTFLKRPVSNTSVAQTDEFPEKYQQLFTDLGYDPDEKTHRIAFQMRHNIISSATDASAGNVGPQTKAKLDDIYREIKDKIPGEGLGLGSVDPQVRILQELLADLGYLHEESTAIFGEKTKEALINFQLERGLINDKNHQAAGYLGPNTHKELEKLALERYSISAGDRAIVARLNAGDEAAASIALADELALQKPSENIDQKDELYQILEDLSHEWVKEHTPQESNLHTFANPEIKLASTNTSSGFMEVKEKLTPIFNPFSNTLRLGSKHKDVEIMQKLLKANGYFHEENITNYFGPKTKKAMALFQVDYGIIASTGSKDAGIVGPKTIKALNALYYNNEFSLPKEIAGKIRAPAIHPSDLSNRQASATGNNL